MQKNDLLDNFNKIYYFDSSNTKGYKIRILEDAKKYKPISSFFKESVDNIKESGKTLSSS